TFEIKTDEDTGQTTIAGMGELHLEVIVERLRREFKVEANVGAPQVSYRETITSSITHRELYKKSLVGAVSLLIWNLKLVLSLTSMNLKRRITTLRLKRALSL